MYPPYHQLGIGLIWAFLYHDQREIINYLAALMKLKHNFFMEFPKATSTATPFHEWSEANYIFSGNSSYLIMMTASLLQSAKDICLSHFRNYVEAAIKHTELQIHPLVSPIFQNLSHFNVSRVLFMHGLIYDQISKISHHLWYNLFEFRNHHSSKKYLSNTVVFPNHNIYFF